MINALFEMNPVASFTIFILVFVVLGFASYSLGRWFARDSVDEKTTVLSGNLSRAVCMLLGLMLSMNFASMRAEYVKIQDSVELEAKEIGGLIYDFERFDTSEAKQVEAKVLEYLDVVITEESSQLLQGRQSQKAENLFFEIESGILALKPDTPYRKELKKRSLKNIDDISNYRTARIYIGTGTLDWFIVVALVGFLISTFLLSVYPPGKIKLVFIACYAAFIGIVLYSIIALDHPYHGVMQVSVKPFQTLYSDSLAKSDLNKVSHQAKNAPGKKYDIR